MSYTNTNTNSSLVDDAPAGYCWCVTAAAKDSVVERLREILHESIWDVERYFEACDAERFMRNDLGASAQFEIPAREHCLGRVADFGYSADEVVLRLISHPENISDFREDGELASDILRGALPDFDGVRADLQTAFEASGFDNFLRFSNEQSRSDAISPLLDKYEALYREAWEAEGAIQVV